MTLKNYACLKARVVFKPRTTTERELFSNLTCLHTPTFISFIIFSLAETISLKIWKIPLSWHAKLEMFLRFPFVAQKRCVPKLFIVMRGRSAFLSFRFIAK